MMLGDFAHHGDTFHGYLTKDKWVKMLQKIASGDLGRDYETKPSSSQWGYEGFDRHMAMRRRMSDHVLLVNASSRFITLHITRAHC